MTPDYRKAGEELAARTRRAQGLPAHVRDRQAARLVAAILTRQNDDPRATDSRGPSTTATTERPTAHASYPAPATNATD